MNVGELSVSDLFVVANSNDNKQNQELRTRDSPNYPGDVTESVIPVNNLRQFTSYHHLQRVYTETKREREGERDEERYLGPQRRGKIQSTDT